MKDGSKIAKKTFVCVAGVAVGLAAFAAQHPELIASESELLRDGGTLRMIWSNLIGEDYSVIQCRSQSGRLAGPWVDQKVLYPKDGGHGMLFRRFDGQLMLTLHQPNVSPKERMRLYPVELTEDGISLKDAGKERAK